MKKQKTSMKKELKKIKQKSAWSEEDEKNLLEISCLIGNYRTGDDEYKLESWLESLKDRALAQPKQEWSDEDELNVLIEYVLKRQKPKQEWSKEDEDILNTIINHFEIDLECTENDDITRWLKSLKNRVQPKQEWSEEDEKMLHNIIKDVMILHNSKTIDGLKCKVNWLKSLKNRVQS